MTFHRIYLPLKDIYLLGGPEAFDSLECNKEGKRNLVVIPSPYRRQMDPTSKQNEGTYGLLGGGAVIDFLDSLKDEKLDRADFQGDLQGTTDDARDVVAVYRISEGLDVAYVDCDVRRNGDVDIVALEDRIRKTWDCENEKPVVLSGRAGLRFEYFSRGIDIQKPDFMMVDSHIVDYGIITGTENLHAKLQEGGGKVPVEIAQDLLNKEWGKMLFMNQFVRFGIKDFGYQYARFTGELQRVGDRITEVKNPVLKLLRPQEYSRQLRIGDVRSDNILGVKPLDMEQYIAMQYGLLNPDVALSFVSGSQGSGKTLLSYATAVDQVLIYDEQYRRKRGGSKGSANMGRFKQIVLFKPNDPIGGKKREVGFLPGDLFEKLGPLLEPFENAHEETSLQEYVSFGDMVLDLGRGNAFSETGRKFKGKLPDSSLPRRAPIKVVYSGNVRGISLKNTLMIIDEAQNFTPYEVNTLLSRLTFGSQAIVCGDAGAQLDNPMCSRDVNGLTAAVQFFLPKHYSMLVNLGQNYRTQISEDTRDWKVYSR